MSSVGFKATQLSGGILRLLQLLPDPGISPLINSQSNIYFGKCPPAVHYLKPDVGSEGQTNRVRWPLSPDWAWQVRVNLILAKKYRAGCRAAVVCLPCGPSQPASQSVSQSVSQPGFLL